MAALAVGGSHAAHGSTLALQAVHWLDCSVLARNCQAANSSGFSLIVGDCEGRNVGDCDGASVGAPVGHELNGDDEGELEGSAV